MSASLSDLDALFDLLADRIAARVLVKLQAPTDDDELIGVPEAMKISGAGDRRVRRAVHDGELVGYGPGGKIRLRRGDVVAWAKSHARKAVIASTPANDDLDEDDLVAARMGLCAVGGGR